LVKNINVIDEDEIEILEGNFEEGEGEIMKIKKGKDPKRSQTILKYNEQKEISEGMIFEEGQTYYVQFKGKKKF
jgi:hypothetical protein